MKKILGLVVLGVAIVGVRKTVSAVRQGGLLEKMETFMERCPPVQAMRKLEEQNDEVIGLLREQNALLWRHSAGEEPAAPAVAKSA